jgi:SpoIID/LytB domain protein
MKYRPVVSALAVAVVLNTFGQITPPASAAATTSVVLIGHGFGHGRGLSQWGALGYAVDQGWSAYSILDHYYGGTTPGLMHNSLLGVRLMDADPASWVTSQQGFSIGEHHLAAGNAGRVVRAGNTWSLYIRTTGCSGGAESGPVSINSGGPVVMRTDASPGDSLSAMLTVCASGRTYRGNLEIVPDGESSRLVNRLEVESYLRGVVPREAIASWGDLGNGRGLQALAAQAVAARSYALAENRYSYAKTCDTTSCQVYLGAGVNGVRQEDRRTDVAVAITAGLVRVRNNAVVRTEFSSSSGGWTTGTVFPHVIDVGDARSPHNTWRVELSGSAISAAYPQIGDYQSLVVTQRDGEGRSGGRVIRMNVAGSAGTVSVSGSEFRFALGLRSDWFFPVSQATSVTYVKTAFAPTVFQQIRVGDWWDRAPISYPEWQGLGFPPVATVSSDVVKYSWDPQIYAVTFWPDDPQWLWQHLTYSDWSGAGFPKPREAGWIFGTHYWRVNGSPVIYAQAPNGGSVTALSYEQWAAAGYPRWEVR